MALKDKLMTLEDFKAVRDVDVASNSAQFTEIKADLEDLDSSLEDKTGIFDWNRRCFVILNVDPVDLTPTANSGIDCVIINCKAGDKFVVSGNGGNQSRLWGFIDSENHILAVADANTVTDGLEITAPENAVKLIVNNQRFANGSVSRVESLANRVTNLETPEIVRTVEFEIGGCGIAPDPNDGNKWKFRFVTATNRARTKKPISLAKGVFRAKTGYEIAVHQLTSDNSDSFGYTDVLWPDYSRFNWSTDFSIFPGCKYAFLNIRKTDSSNFTENEIKTLWEDAITVEYAEKDGKVNKNNGVLMTEKDGCASQIIIAANNSTEHDKEIADYVCCGVNDENVLQAAINYFGDNSGIIQLCNGMYNIDKFKRIDGYDYGLYIEKKLREIIIRGCNHNHKANGDSFAGADKCPVIRVGNAAWNGLDSTKESYVIGSNREWEFPYKVLGVEDLTIAIPNNTKPLVGIDGMYLADLHVYRCFFRTEGSYTDDVNINPKCIAIRGCPGGQIGYNYSFEHIKIIGWGTGLQFNGEASTIIDVQIQRAAFGFVFGNIDELNPYPRHGGIHPSVMIDCGASNCAKSIVVFGTGNRNTIEIIAFNCEAGGDNYTIPGSILWKADKIFEYRSNGTMMGSVTYAFVDAVGGWLPNPINIWGDDHSADPYFRTTDLRARTKGTTAERPEDPCFMSKYYDTTIEKFIMFNGTDWVEIS